MTSITAAEFDAVAAQLHRLCGIVLSARKDYLVCQRLGPLLEEHGLADWNSLISVLRDRPRGSIADEVIHAITTHETSFFRDGHPFQTLGDRVLPELAGLVEERKARPFPRRGAQVSIWSAATSSGQEAYSLSMLIDEYARQHESIQPQDFLILGTDISAQVLSQAVAGIYGDHEVGRGLSDARRNRYFEEVEPGRWRVNDELRRLVQFQACSLIEPFAHLGGFDLILCRNVLIYFDEATRLELIDGFGRMLAPEGFLMLGATESLLPVPAPFEATRHGQTLLYRKRSDG